MSEETFTLNTKGLDQLVKAFKGKPPRTRVGILGDSSRQAKGNAPTNAEIGAVHEYGSPARGIPQRSFLRVPVTERLEKELEGSGALDKEAMAEVIKSGSMLAWMKKLAVLAEGIVIQAFDTAGFGKWKPSNMAHKKNHQTLVETQQLRNSITSEVKE